MTSETATARITSFAEFYPFYVWEHSVLSSRRLHFVGSTGVLLLLAWTLYSGNPWWLLAVPFMGYGFAWVGHFFFEKNKPATFTYPLWSLIGDWVMYKDILIGRVRF